MEVDLADGNPSTALLLGVVLLGIGFQAAGSVLVALCDASGLILSFWRFTLSLPILGVVVWRAGFSRKDFRTGSGMRWALIGGVAFAAHQVAFMVAVQTTSVVDVALMQVLQPLLVGMAAAPLFGERITGWFRIWSIVGMLGAAYVVLDGSGGASGNPAGMALAVVAVVFFVGFFLCSKQARPLMPVSNFLLAVTVVSWVLVSLAAGLSHTPVLAISGHDMAMVLGFSLMGGILGHYLVTWSLRYLPVSLPPVLQLSFPLIAGVLAWVVIGQPVSTAHLFGGVLIVAGVLGAVRSAPNAQGHPTPGTTASTA